MQENGGISLIDWSGIPSTWKLGKLGDYCEIRRGASPRPAGDPRYFGGGIPWFKIGDATKNPGRFLTETAETVNEEGARRSVQIPAGSLIIANSGVSLGFAVFVGVTGCVHDGWLVLNNFNGIDDRYIFYCVNLLTNALRGMADGTTQPNLNTTIARNLLIPVPPIDEQRRIAETLWSLDDKIELNRRMNATLEAMARALFKAWFVDFEPVHANLENRPSISASPEIAKLFPSDFENGIPKGWQRTTFGTAYEIFDSKRIPLSGKQRESRKGTYPYYGAASIMDHVDGYLFDGVYLLIGEDGSVTKSDGTPVVQYAWGKFWVNNHAHVLQGKGEISTEHLMLAVQDENIVPYVTGAVQPKLNQGNLARIPFIKPTDDVEKRFSESITSLYSKIRQNADENRCLAEIRDSLLPRLISGKIKVEVQNHAAKD